MATSFSPSAASCACGAAYVAGAAFCIECGVPRPTQQFASAPDQAWNGVEAGASGCSHCLSRRKHPKDPFAPFCPVCRRLDPLANDYVLPVDVYMTELDRQAMGTLASIAPLRAAAHALSDKVGRPWLESAVNGIRLGPDQLPDIFALAIQAARIVGLRTLPELYISGEQMWDCMTLGSESQSFIVIGSIAASLKGDDLLYALGREMGHVAAGHTVWKALMQLTQGRQQNKTILGHGVTQFLNPLRLAEAAIDAPLMAWARHAEITADRAGALVTGNKAAAKRVAIQWTLKSFPLFARLNLDALEREVAQSDDRQLQVSEWAMSSTPYLARRLRLMNEFFASSQFTGWRATVEHWLAVEKDKAERPLAAVPPQPKVTDGIRLTCVVCAETMRVSREELQGKESVRVKCPNAACGKILEVTPKPPDKAEVRRVAPPALRLKCVACGVAMQAPLEAVLANPETHVRCPNPQCRKILTVRRPSSVTPKVAQGPEADRLVPGERGNAHSSAEG